MLTTGAVTIHLHQLGRTGLSPDHHPMAHVAARKRRLIMTSGVRPLCQVLMDLDLHSQHLDGNRKLQETRVLVMHNIGLVYAQALHQPTRGL